MVKKEDVIEFGFDEKHVKDNVLSGNYELEMINIARRSVKRSVNYNRLFLKETNTKEKIEEYRRHVATNIYDLYPKENEFVRVEDVDEYIESLYNESEKILSLNNTLDVFDATKYFNLDERNEFNQDAFEEFKYELGYLNHNCVLMIKEFSKGKYITDGDIMGLLITINDSSYIIPMYLDFAQEILKIHLMMNKERLGTNLLFNLDIEIDKTYLIMDYKDVEISIGYVGVNYKYNGSSLSNSNIDIMTEVGDSYKLLELSMTENGDMKKPRFNQNILTDSMVFSLENHEEYENYENLTDKNLYHYKHQAVNTNSSYNHGGISTNVFRNYWWTDRFFELKKAVTIDENYNIKFNDKVNLLNSAYELKERLFYNYSYNGLGVKEDEKNKSYTSVFNGLHVEEYWGIYDILTAIHEFNLGFIQRKENDKPFVNIDVDKRETFDDMNPRLINQLSFVGRTDVVPVQILTELFNHYDTSSSLYNVNKKFLKTKEDIDRIEQYKNEMYEKYGKKFDIENCSLHLVSNHKSMFKGTLNKDVDWYHTIISGTNEEILGLIYSNEIHKLYNKNNNVKIFVDYLDNNLMSMVISEDVRGINRERTYNLYNFDNDKSDVELSQKVMFVFREIINYSTVGNMFRKLETTDYYSNLGIDLKELIKDVNESVDLKKKDEMCKDIVVSQLTCKENRLKAPTGPKGTGLMVFSNYMTFVYDNGIYDLSDFLSYQHMIFAHLDITKNVFMDDFYNDRVLTSGVLMNDMTQYYYPYSNIVTGKSSGYKTDVFGFGDLTKPRFFSKLTSMEESKVQSNMLKIKPIREYLESM